MQARMYLPAYGKFAQPDPAYDQTKDGPESWNLYSYCMNNPVTHTDPDGRKSAGETPPPAPTPGQQQEDWNRIHGFSASNSTANAATNNLLKVISDNGHGGQFRSLTGDSKQSNRGFIADIMLGNKADMGYGAAKAKLASFGSTSISGFRQIWDSPNHMRYDIGTRNSFHGSGAIEPARKNPLILGPHVYFNGP